MMRKMMLFLKEWMSSWKKVSWPAPGELVVGWVSVMCVLFVGGLCVRGIDMLARFVVNRVVFGYL